MLRARLAWRFFVPKNRRFSFFLALSCLSLGVACLVLTSSVVSGFQSSLRNSVIDVTGDVLVSSRRAAIEDVKQMWQKIRPEVEKVSKESDHLPFLITQAVVSSGSRLAGVIVEGLETTERVVDLQSRAVAGDILLGTSLEPPYPVLIGKGLAKKFDLKVGEQVKVVFPVMDDLNPQNFSRKIGTFRVQGILDLGKYEYDQRYILTRLDIIQKILNLQGGYSGVLISLPDPELASQVSKNINRAYPGSYRSRDWFQVNRNLFQAIDIEKRVIMLVVSIIVLVAAFNIASSLYINVVQKYREIAILKSLGLRQGAIVQVFLLQGLFIGLIGLAGGLFLGLGFNSAFQYILQHHLQIPGEVYKLNQLNLELRASDILQIAALTLGVCLLSTLAPALHGSRIRVTEGLRYE